MQLHIEQPSLKKSFALSSVVQNAFPLAAKCVLIFSAHLSSRNSWTRLVAVCVGGLSQRGSVWIYL